MTHTLPHRPSRTGDPATDPLTRPATLELVGLGKRYAPGLPPVVDDLNLRVESGELLTLLGPSGCGKTTTLRLIAGLERPDSGEIRIDGRIVTAPFTPPNGAAWVWSFRITRCSRT
ncbi:ATP-binding cassette domain-containing protein [Deinococcus aquaticus]|uniref:ATP-binding cassette domain-containing protein n=1 Tax=Deinococcus aquaticus TaxID=328692 RepID=UPI003616E5E7